MNNNEFDRQRSDGIIFNENLGQTAEQFHCATECCRGCSLGAFDRVFNNVPVQLIPSQPPRPITIEKLTSPSLANSFAAKLQALGIRLDEREWNIDDTLILHFGFESGGSGI